MEPFRRPEVAAYAALLAESFHRLLGRPLCEDGSAQGIWTLAQPLVSHGTEADPVFRYGNAAALALWDMDWDAFTRLPSRQSAADTPEVQADRARLLETARQRGWVPGYTGIRISARGRRFRISDVILWTVTDAAGTCHGQAALIGRVENI